MTNKELYERFYDLVDRGFYPTDAYDIVSHDGRWDLLDLIQLSSTVVGLCNDTANHKREDPNDDKSQDNIEGWHILSELSVHN